MRRFKFRLEAVLKHREALENLREQDFAMAAGVVNVIEARLKAHWTAYRETVAARPGNAAGERFDAPGILDRERYLETLHVAILGLEHQKEAAMIAVEATRRALIEARKAREAVSKLKEKDLGAHTAHVLKIEQDALDEMATMRYVREQISEVPEAAERERPLAAPEPMPVLSVFQKWQETPVQKEAA